jgi:hypothetical protein
MARGKLPLIFTPNTLESMIEYTLISRIDGGTCRRALNEEESKVHYLRTKFEKEKVKNTSMDGFLILTKLCKLKK